MWYETFWHCRKTLDIILTVISTYGRLLSITPIYSSHSIVQCCIVLYSIVWYSIVLYCIVMPVCRGVVRGTVPKQGNLLLLYSVISVLFWKSLPYINHCMNFVLQLGGVFPSRFSGVTCHHTHTAYFHHSSTVCHHYLSVLDWYILNKKAIKLQGDIELPWYWISLPYWRGVVLSMNLKGGSWQKCPNELISPCLIKWSASESTDIHSIWLSHILDEINITISSFKW